MPDLDKLKAQLEAALAWINEQLHNQIPVTPPTPPEQPPTPQNLTVADIKAAHDTGWRGGPLADRQAMWDLAKQICKDEGLGISMTADLLATVHGESGFNRWCVNDKNKNGSIDVGLCQFNSNTYLKEYNMTEVDALTKPADCLHIMARNFKAGRATNWYAYQYYKKLSAVQQQANQARPNV